MEPIPNEVVNQLAPTSTPPPAVNPEDKPKKSHKAFFFLIGIFIILILFGGMGGAYFLGKNNSKTNMATTSTISQSSESNSPTPTSEPELTAEKGLSANWKTYTNTKYNYLLKYPTNFYLVKGPAENLPDEKFQTSDNISFSQTQSKEDPNYGGVLTISIDPKNKNGQSIQCISTEDCLNKITQETLNPVPANTLKITKLIDNQTFSGFKYRSPNNSLYTQDNIYVGLYKNGKFYIISYTLNNETNGKLENEVNRILSTFKFTN